MPANVTPIKASTQEFLDIADIVDDLVLLADGSVALVLATTALNFGLLSEREQEAIIFAYAGLLNSLSFSIQIVVRSQRKDVSGYLKQLEVAEAKQKNPLLVKMMKGYRKFVAQTVQENNVLEKRFYVVIPFSSLEIGVTKSALSALKPGKKSLPYEKQYILEKAKVSLYPKRDHLIRQFNRLGLKVHQLNTQELIQVFFEIYNPEAGSRLAAAEEYGQPLVKGEPRYERAIGRMQEVQGEGKGEVAGQTRGLVEEKKV